MRVPLVPALFVAMAVAPAAGARDVPKMRDCLKIVVSGERVHVKVTNRSVVSCGEARQVTRKFMKRVPPDGVVHRQGRWKCSWRNDAAKGVRLRCVDRSDHVLTARSAPPRK
ncbi:hypothetical protein ACVU7I_03120 [Patulibacter sp. S7RM1-6]